MTAEPAGRGRNRILRGLQPKRTNSCVQIGEDEFPLTHELQKHSTRCKKNALLTTAEVHQGHQPASTRSRFLQMLPNRGERI